MKVDSLLLSYFIDNPLPMSEYYGEKSSDTSEHLLNRSLLRKHLQ